MTAALAAWALTVLALAQPERVGEPVEVTKAARDVVLAIDISGSMDARDFETPEGSASSGSQVCATWCGPSSRAARATAWR